MRDTTALTDLLRRLDGKGYGSYKELEGAWRFPGFTLHVDHVQADPFAAPSRLRLVVPAETTGFPEDVRRSEPRRVAAGSFLARALAQRAREASSRRGTGRSGDVVVEAPGQEVLPQTAVQLDGDGSVDARLGMGLPARGRRVVGPEAATLLLQTVPGLVRDALVVSAHDAEELLRHAETTEDAEHLRALLPSLELVAFVADGSVLPRRSGVDDRPLEGDGVVPFRSPPRTMAGRWS